MTPSQQIESREDMKRLESIRKQLSESQDPEEIRAIALPMLDREIKQQRRLIEGVKV